MKKISPALLVSGGCATLFAGAALSSMNSCAPAKEEKVQERPNILFILSDDHSREAISAYGGILSELAPTPNIDAIAENGTIMENMICTNSISGPSRACLITGKYGTTNGFYQNEGGIVYNSDQATSQSILHDNGYTTALFGKWHLFSMPVGFDYYKIHNDASQQGTYWDPVFSENGTQVKEKGYATTLTADAAINWLDNIRDKSKPFCTMLHFKAPHRPWEADSMYLDLYDDVTFPYPESFNDDYSTRELTAGKSMATIEHHISRGDLKMTPPEGLSPKESDKWLWWGGSGSNQFWTPNDSLQGQELKNWKYQEYIKTYLRTVRSVDDQVGRVTQYLKDNGLYENTIIVYMGDQGFYLGEHGWYDKRWIYEESIQMACIVSYPKGMSEGMKKGNRLSDLVANVDIAPTLLDYAGIEIPSDMHGKSFKGLLEGDESVRELWRDAVYYHYFEYPKWHNVQPHYGMRGKRYKLAHFYYNIDIWEFYDLEKDPNELTNQYDNPEYKEIIEQMKPELYRLQEEAGDKMTMDERRELTERYMLKYEDQE